MRSWHVRLPSARVAHQEAFAVAAGRTPSSRVEPVGAEVREAELTLRGLECARVPAAGVWDPRGLEWAGARAAVFGYPGPLRVEASVWALGGCARERSPRR